MDIGQKILTRRKQLGLTLDQLGKAINVDPSNVMRYEKSKINKIPIQIIVPLSKALQCSPLYFINDEEEEDDLLPLKIKIIAPFSNKIISIDDCEAIDQIVLPTSMLVIKGQYFGQRADDDSMKGFGISAGDLLIYRSTAVPQDNTTGCFCLNEGLSINRKYQLDAKGKAHLLSGNDEFPVISIEKDDNKLRTFGMLSVVIHPTESI